MPAAGAGIVSVGGRRAGLVRDARSDSYARVHGLATVSAGPVFVVRAVLSKIERGPRGLLTVRSRMLSRVCQVPPLLDRRGVTGGRSVSAGERPAEAGELAGDGDRDDRAPLPALISEAAPDAMEPALRLPGDRDDGGVLAFLAALEGGAAGGGLAVLPAGLDQQPARVP